MDWGSSLFSKAGEKLRSLEQDVTKELGLRGLDKDAGGVVEDWEGDQLGGEEAEDAFDDEGWEDIGDIKLGHDEPDDTPSADREISKSAAVQTEEHAHTASDLKIQKSLAAEILTLEGRLIEERARSDAATRKLNAIKREMQAAQRRSEGAESSDLVREKDERIQAVLKEGDGLREKARVREEDSVRLRQEALKSEEEANDLQDQLQVLQAKSESAIARLKQLEALNKTTQEEKEAAESRLREAGSETRSREGTLAALEATQRELSSLRANQESLIAEQREAILFEDKEAREHVEERARITEEAMVREIGHLRAQLTQAMESTGWREDSTRKESTDLRRACQHLESRNEELAAAVPEATRPLLRQIEQLQAESSERFRRTAREEKEQTEKLREAEAKISAVSERERLADSRIGALMSRKAALHQQQSIQSEEESRLQQSIEDKMSVLVAMESRHLEAMDLLERQRLKGQLELEGIVAAMEKEKAANSKAIELLEASLLSREKELDRVREEKKEIDRKADELSTQTLRRPHNARTPSAGPSRVEGEDANTDLLRDKFGIVVSLQAQLASKEAAIQALAEEVVEHTRECEAAESDIAAVPSFAGQVKELDEKHNALLTLYGENEEQIQESEQDIDDVKVMYKEQMTELLFELERAQEVGRA